MYNVNCAYQWGLPEPKTILCSELHEHILSGLRAYFAAESVYTVQHHMFSGNTILV